MSSPPPPKPPSTTAAGGAVIPNPPPPQQQPPKPLNPPLLQNPHHHQHHPYHQPATAAAFPPPTQRHQQQQQPTIYPNSRNHQQQSSAAKPQDPGILYPVASSGNRGFLPKTHHHHQTTDQSAVPVANSGGFPPRPVTGYPYRPYGFSNSDVSGQSLHHLVRPSGHLLQTLPNSTGGMLPSIGRGVLVPVDLKVVAPSSVADGNGFKDVRDKTGDDTFVIIRDRKVQVSEGTSLYAICRSWLKNGLTEGTQPQYVDCVKSLPKPLPASMIDLQVTKEDDQEKEEEKIEDAEHLSAEDLLEQHIKHAKKVRARLRDRRLQRIERYKGRLALLLPPVVEQQQRNDPASGN